VNRAKPQTKTEIRERLAAAGIRPNRLRGQNFLIDGNLMRTVVDAAGLKPGDFVFEVGTGTAGLTALLADGAGEVLTVEVDPALSAIARQVLAGRGNVTLLQADVLAGKHVLDPDVRTALTEKASHHARTVLAANLPYSIATPLIVNLLMGEVAFDLMVFTVQREVADRMTASPGTRDYGWVSVVMALSCEAEVLRRLPRQAFWPAPDVESSLVRLRPRPGWREGIDVSMLREIGPIVFQQRRKTVKRILKNYLKRTGRTLREEALLDEAGVEPSVRGDQLTPEQIVRLGEAIGRQTK
jgi:16S rRNA (adenine1518-N6/adenine1519-N6)-dimethyltransferase